MHTWDRSCLLELPISTREECLLEKHTYQRNISLGNTSLSNVLIYVYLTERASQRCTSHGGVHLKGVCLSWARLFRGHASQRPASHRLTSPCTGNTSSSLGGLWTARGLAPKL